MEENTLLTLNGVLTAVANEVSCLEEIVGARMRERFFGKPKHHQHGPDFSQLTRDFSEFQSFCVFHFFLWIFPNSYFSAKQARTFHLVSENG